jgi:hypothetical protein
MVSYIPLLYWSNYVELVMEAKILGDILSLLKIVVVK